MPREPIIHECFSAPNDAILVRLAVVAPAALSLHQLEGNDGAAGTGIPGKGCPHVPSLRFTNRVGVRTTFIEENTR
jgi:hypothetical protein